MDKGAFTKLLNMFKGGKRRVSMDEPNPESGSTQLSKEQAKGWGKYGALLKEPRWLLHVSTDKPIYRLSETVYVRAVVVGALNTLPLVSNSTPPAVTSLQVKFQVISPKGEPIFTWSYGLNVQDSVIHASWPVPDGQEGGEYIARFSTDPNKWDFTPPVERKFQIRAFRNPKLRVKVEFVGSGYGPGDEVLAKVSVTRTEGGGKPAGAKVTLTARLDGKVVHGPLQSELDEAGECQVAFALPEKIAEGMGSLTAVVQDGGVVESGSKTLPVVLRTLNIKFYPEGGPLIEGLRSRIYFEALTPTDEPVDLLGQIWAVENGKDKEPVADVTSKHEGRGSFFLTPQPGVAYELRLSKPAGVTVCPALPPREAKGPNGQPLISLTAKSDTFDHEKLEFDLASAEATQVKLVIFKKEVELASANVSLPGGGQVVPVQLALPVSHGGKRFGTLRATVLGDADVPLAERLVFVKPLESLQVEVTSATAEDAVPGSDQVVEIRVKDSNGRPVKGAVIGLCVTDASTLGMVEDRRQAPRLPAMVYLESEVEHLEDCGAYLQPTEHGAIATDLLLGTQGWRRFAYFSPVKSLLPPATSDEAKKEAEKMQRAMGISLKDPSIQMQNWSKGGERGMYKASKGRAGLLREGWRGVGDADGAMFPAGAKIAFDGVEGAMAKDEEEDEEEEELVEAGFVRQMAMPLGGPGMFDESECGEEEEGMAAGVAPERAMAMVAGGEMQELAEAEAEAPAPAPPEAPAPAPPPPPFMPMLAQGRMAPAEKEKKKKKIAAPNRKKSMIVSDSEPSAFVRVYAHTTKKGEGGGESDRVRADFTETLFWNPSMITSADGVARAEFSLSDSITSFAVIADVHCTPGKPGGAGLFAASPPFLIRSSRPFHVDAKVPLQVTAGDRVSMPVMVVNASDTGVEASVAVTVDAPLEISGSNSSPTTLKVEAKERVRHLVPLDVLPPKKVALSASKDAKAPAQVDDDEDDVPGNVMATVKIVATAVAEGGGSLSSSMSPDHRDSVQRSVSVEPSGFPMHLSFGGMLQPDQEPKGQDLLLPPQISEGSLEVSILLYTSPVGSLMQALEALLREPYGCFEQTSATVYPNIMAQLYFKTHTGVDPSIVKRSYALLEKGFERLKGFEVGGDSGGYEWFGGAPAHEALTAYGLLEFMDLAKVFPVPKEMLKRTTEWLLSCRDDSGGFSINPRQLDSFGGAPKDITIAYIVWSLTYAGITQGLDSQVSSLLSQAATNKDPYFRGLVAGSLINIRREKEALPFARELFLLQKKDGRVDDAKTSITRSGGNSLVVETTAIAALVWIDCEGDDFAAATHEAIQWISTMCQNGSFGSTQATVLALKAIVAYDERKAKPLLAGVAHVLLNGESLQALPFDSKAPAKLALDGEAVARALRPGTTNRLQLKMDKGTEMPFSVQVRFNTPTPPSNSGCALSLSTSLSSPSAPEAATVEVAVKLQNLMAEPLPMTLAIVGFPGGLEPRHDQLKELVTRGVIAFYEVRGREVILYWRTIAASSVVSLSLEATAAVPGVYVGPASRAYLYYTDEYKHWVEPLCIAITPAWSRRRA